MKNHVQYLLLLKTASCCILLFFLNTGCEDEEEYTADETFTFQYVWQENMDGLSSYAINATGAAFKPCSTKLDMRVDHNRTQNPPAVIIDYNDFQRYATAQQTLGNAVEGILLAVKNAVNIPLFYPSIYGVALYKKYSYVFIQEIRDRTSSNFNYRDYVSARVATHELGHQRANILDNDIHDGGGIYAICCVMQLEGDIQGNSQCGITRSPVFCNKHKQEIDAQSW